MATLALVSPVLATEGRSSLLVGAAVPPSCDVLWARPAPGAVAPASLHVMCPRGTPFTVTADASVAHARTDHVAAGVHATVIHWTDADIAPATGTGNRVITVAY